MSGAKKNAVQNTLLLFPFRRMDKRMSDEHAVRCVVFVMPMAAQTGCTVSVEEVLWFLRRILLFLR